MKKAIILAAGLGKRLGSLTKDIPKCLLIVDLRTGKTLIDYSLESLLNCGFKEIVFISGFAAKVLESHIDKNWRDKFSFKFIFNEKYADYNNIYSAYLAKDLWDDETVLLNSDIVFHPDIFKSLKSQVSSFKSFLVIDDSKVLTPESMKIEIDKEKRIKKISKNLDSKTSFGEYIGITYLKGVERVKFLKSLCVNIKDKNFDLYYEDALADILEKSEVFPCPTLGLPWTEVDTEEDLNYARQITKKINNPAIVS